MTDLSCEQRRVVEAPLAPLSVVACAGSGKTKTAVHRLVEIRQRVATDRGYVALLSFSNTAVRIFRSEYLRLLRRFPGASWQRGITIETADSFITTNILRPHAHRTMGSPRSPFLISGAEPFLQNKKFRFWASDKTGKMFRVSADKVVVSLIEGKPRFSYSVEQGGTQGLNDGQYAAEQLGAVGAYTHDIGRYWAYRTLLEQPWILRALAHRYPHILVDEAQDIGTIHQAILELLADAGAEVSLIGDPDQAIFEFAGADGRFLREYATRELTTPYSLTTNHRSVPAIVQVANAVARRSANAHRGASASPQGAFIVPYADSQEASLIEAFQSKIVAAGLDLGRSAVVCRSRKLAHQLRGTNSQHGQGLVKGFASAAILRDVRADYHEALKVTAGCIVALLANAEETTAFKILAAGHYPEAKPLRRAMWTFVRNPDVGLPPASLVGDTEWHPLLVERLKCLLESFHANFGLGCVDHLGNRLSKKELPHTPLAALDARTTQYNAIRVDTVHQVKGETLDAVLYIATKLHAGALVKGVGTEDGRIGYVALTRARDLFWLGVPQKSLAELKESLLALGFREWDQDPCHVWVGPRGVVRQLEAVQ